MLLQRASERHMVLLQEWKHCQALCNSISLNKKINSFDIRRVSMETAKNAKNILDNIRVEEVQDASEVAANFYVWVRDVTVSFRTFVHTVHSYSEIYSCFSRSG